MAVEIIDDKRLWDGFIDESPNSTLFHKWDFLKIVEKHTGYKAFLYGVYRNGKLASLIPMFYQRRKGLKFTYSPPQATLSYIPYMGIALSRAFSDMKRPEKEDYLCYILDEVDKALKPLSPNYISLAMGPGGIDLRPYIWHGYEVIPQYTYVLDLSRPLDALWRDMSHTFRKEISDISKLGLSIERAYDAKALFGIMRKRLKNVYDSDTFYSRQSPDYLVDLMTAFPDNIKMYSIRRGGQFLGGIVNCEYHDNCIAWMGNAAVADGVNSNGYMLWMLIKMAKGAGIKKFDILGADEKRLNRFKAKFNPLPEPYFYAIKTDIVYKMASFGVGRLDKLVQEWYGHTRAGPQKGVPETIQIEVEVK